VRDALETLRRGLPAGIEVQFEADEEAAWSKPIPRR